MIADSKSPIALVAEEQDALKAAAVQRRNRVASRNTRHRFRFVCSSSGARTPWKFWRPRRSLSIAAALDLASLDGSLVPELSV